MDVVLHPNFTTNNLVYLAYAAGTSEASHLVLMRARLEGDKLMSPEILYKTQNRNRPVLWWQACVFERWFTYPDAWRCF